MTPFIGSKAQPSQVFNSAATFEIVSGLQNGRTYTFEVAAQNANGTGPRSDASNKTTVGSPGAPTDVTAVKAGHRVKVSWKAPPAEAGAPITGYIVTPYIGTRAQGAHKFSSRATHQNISGLKAGAVYSFKVAAMNKYGTGPRSFASNRVRPV